MALASLGSLIGRYRWRFVIANVGRFVSGALPAFHPYFLAKLATSINEPDQALRYLLLLFGTGLLHLITWSACDFYVAARIQPLTSEYKRMAFDTVWGENYQRFIARPSGKTASYVNDLRDTVGHLWLSVHTGFLPLLSRLPVYVFLLWQSSAGYAFGYVIFLFLTARVLTRLVGPLNLRQRRLTNSVGTNNGRVFDSYANFVNVFSFRSHRKEIDRNDREVDEVIDREMTFQYWMAGYWTTASMLVRGLLWAAIMGFSWWQFSRGNIGYEAMVVSITVMVDFTNQFWQVVHFWGHWVDKLARFKESYNFLFPGRNMVAEYDPNRRPRSDSPVGPSSIGSTLEVRNVSFAYPDAPDTPILHDISFTLNRGEKLGIVGRSGEGKSTLIKLLLGFYAPTSGQILVDGRPVGPEELSRVQSYVPQDTSLFEETIAYNIGYAVEGNPTAGAVAAAARQANVSDFIESLPLGYDTMVGERGVKLSLGQRQRIAIARAFLKESDLIILDEATSSLDSETESRIQSALVDLWADKAAIVIAHRLATLNDVDRIAVIDGGRIVEQGSKADLLVQPGLFAELWGLQRDGMSDDVAPIPSLSRTGFDFGPEDIISKRDSGRGAFTISLPVTDLAASIKFYEKLGFRVTGGDEETWATLINGPAIVGLFQGMFEKPMLTFNPGRPYDAMELNNLSDVRAIRSAPVLVGAPAGRDSIEASRPSPASFVVTDPDGNSILVDQHL